MTNSRRRDSEVRGTLRSVGDVGVVRMEDTYGTDIDDLWSALTEPSRLGRWIADVEGELSVGGAFHARFTSGWEGPGRVDVCESPRRLVLTMDPGTPDETVIEAELREDGAATLLTIEERGIPVGELAAHGAGWHAHVEDLAAHLAGRTRVDWNARWAELTPTYSAQVHGESLTS